MRAELRNIKLPHTNSNYYESIWQNNLNDLRYFVARNYTAIILGIKDLINFHHLNSPKGINSTTDYILYELLYDFSAKIVMLVLNNENNEQTNTIIQNEINRLFREKVGGTDKYFLNIEKQERKILEGKFTIPREWKCETPCLTEIKRPGRDKRIFHIGTSVIKTRNLRLRIFQAALLIPDKSLKKANIKIGILGMPKKNFPPLLTCSQISRKSERNTIKEKRTKNEEKNIKDLSAKPETEISYDLLKSKTNKRSNDIIDIQKCAEETRKTNDDIKISEFKDFEDNDEGILENENKTKFLVALELFTLLLYLKKEKNKQNKQKRFINKMKRRCELENIVGGDKTFLVEKEYPSQPYCLSYKLLNKTKTFDRDKAVALWTKYSSATKRFFYRIDPFSSLVDDYIIN